MPVRIRYVLRLASTLRFHAFSDFSAQRGDALRVACNVVETKVNGCYSCSRRYQYHVMNEVAIAHDGVIDVWRFGLGLVYLLYLSQAALWTWNRQLAKALY